MQETYYNYIELSENIDSIKKDGINYQLYELTNFSRKLEKKYRQLFLYHNSSNLLKNPYLTLISVFDNKKIFDPMKLESSSVLFKNNKTINIVQNINIFKKNFNIFSENQLLKIKWENILVTGESILACLLKVPDEHNLDNYLLRNYYHNIMYKNTDIDIFIYGLNDDESNRKIIEIYEAVSSILTTKPICVKTKNKVSIISNYPYRHLNIILKLYKSPAEILMNIDIDCNSVGYDGNKVYVTPRAHHSLKYGENIVYTSNQHVSKDKLYKYGMMGFQVKIDNLKKKINPQLFMKDNLQGIDKLFFLDKLPLKYNQEKFKNICCSFKLEHSNNDCNKSKYDTTNHALPWGPEYDLNKISSILVMNDEYTDLCLDGFNDKIFDGKLVYNENNNSDYQSNNENDNSDYDMYIDDLDIQFMMSIIDKKNDIFKNLLDYKKVNINKRDYMGRTPLHLSIIYDNIYSLEHLLENGADTTLRIDGKTLCHLTCQYGNLNILKIIMDDHINVPDSSYGVPPVFYSVICNHINIFEYMIEFIDLTINKLEWILLDDNGREYNRYSILRFCMMLGRFDFVDILLKYNYEINEIISYGSTKLHILTELIKNCDFKSIKYLVEKGYNTNIFSYNGFIESPLVTSIKCYLKNDQKLKRNYQEIILYLLKLGAKTVYSVNDLKSDINLIPSYNHPFIQDKLIQPIDIAMDNHINNHMDNPNIDYWLIKTLVNANKDLVNCVFGNKLKGYNVPLSKIISNIQDIKYKINSLNSVDENSFFDNEISMGLALNLSKNHINFDSRLNDYLRIKYLLEKNKAKLLTEIKVKDTPENKELLEFITDIKKNKTIVTKDNKNNKIEYFIMSKYSLESSINKKLVKKKKYNEFFEAVWIGNKSKILDFIENNKNFELICSSISNRTPIHLAICKKNFDVFNLLFDFYCNENSKPSDLNLFLSIKSENLNLIPYMIKYRAYECLKLFLEKIYLFDLKNIREILNKTYFLDGNNMTILEYCLLKGWIGYIGLLVQYLDFDHIVDKSTIFEACAKGGNPKSLLFIFKHAKEIFTNDCLPKDFDINYVDSYGNNILHYLCKNIPNIDDSCLQDYLNCYRLVIKLQPLNLCKTNNRNETPLMVSVNSKNFYIFQLLLEYGSSMLEFNCDGMNIIHIVSKYGTVKQMETLLRFDINLIDKQTIGTKHTPLIIAIKEKNYEVFSYLFYRKTNKNIIDIFGNNVYHYIAINYYKLVKLDGEWNQENSFGFTAYDYLVKGIIRAFDYKSTGFNECKYDQQKINNLYDMVNSMKDIGNRKYTNYAIVNNTFNFIFDNLDYELV